MIFMRYKAAEVEGLTPGKIYFGEPAMQSGELVSYDSIKIHDDNDKLLRVDPAKEEFEFLDEVYAVKVIEEIGTVVTVVDMEVKEDKCFVEIKDVGYRSCSSVLVLDRTNVYPGVTVLDRLTNRWQGITSVNDSLWVKTSCDGAYRPPTDFRFAIEGGDILLQPFARCIWPVGPDLTDGKLYCLLAGGFDPDGTVEAYGDSGLKMEFLASRFKIF